MSSERLAVVRVGTTPPEVVTFVRVDTAAAPAGFALVPESSLPPGWVPSPDEPPPVPETVTPWQFFTWLWQRKRMTRQHILSMLSSLPDDHRVQAEIDLDRAQSYRRSHPLVASFGPALGMSEQEIDEAFREMAEMT